MDLDEGLQTVVQQLQTAAAQQMTQQETRAYRETHSHQLLAIQRSLALRSVSPASVMSRKDLLRQELRQAQHRTELQANAYEPAKYYQLDSFPVWLPDFGTKTSRVAMQVLSRMPPITTRNKKNTSWKQ
eukprot:2053143-Amphidinium_carterae.2